MGQVSGGVVVQGWRAEVGLPWRESSIVIEIVHYSDQWYHFNYLLWHVILSQVQFSFFECYPVRSKRIK